LLLCLSPPENFLPSSLVERIGLSRLLLYLFSSYSFFCCSLASPPGADPSPCLSSPLLSAFLLISFDFEDQLVPPTLPS